MNDQNERFDDREIKMLYKENAQRTAPDMEKLWSRIESEIDKTDAVPQRTIVQTKKTTNNKTMIRAIISCAATFIIVFGITAIIARNSASPDKASDKNIVGGSKITASDNTVYGAEELAGGTDVTTSTKTNGASYGEKISVDGEQMDKPVGIDTKDKHEDNAGVNDILPDTDQTAEAPENENTEGSPRTAEDKRSETQQGEAADAETATLSRTTAFLDAKVTGTEQTGDSCTYTLEIVKNYGKSGTSEGGEVKLSAEIPLGLTVGAEYLIPVTEYANGLHPALYREAQVMFIGDGRIMFPSLWTTLAEGAEDLGDGLMAVTSDSVEKLIAKWRNI